MSTQVIHETLAENTAKHEGEKNPPVRVRADEKVSENSKLESYRFCEETWTMELTDAEVQLPGNVPPIKLPRAMIVAVPSAQSFAPRHLTSLRVVLPVVASPALQDFLGG